MIKMSEEFKELFSNLSEKDQKEVANLIRFKNEVKYHDKQFEELLQQYIELSREHDKLQNNWNELKEFVEEEIKHLEKSRYVSFNEYGENKLRIFKDFQFKMQELEQGKDE